MRNEHQQDGLTPDQLRFVLRSANGPRRLSNAELHRINEAMLSESPHAESSVVEDVLFPIGGERANELIELDDADRSGHVAFAGQARRSRLMGAAVLLVVVGASVVVLFGRMERVSDVDAVAPTAAICPSSIPAVSDALEQWRSLVAWASVGNSDPDLGGLLLIALAELSPSPEVRVAEEELADAIRQSENEQGRHTAARLKAAQESIRLILDAATEVEGNDCDLSVLRSALE